MGNISGRPSLVVSGPTRRRQRRHSPPDAVVKVTIPVEVLQSPRLAGSGTEPPAPKPLSVTGMIRLWTVDQ